MTLKSKIIAVLILVVLVAAWAITYSSFKENSLEIRTGNFEVYALTDSAMGGYSTSQLEVGDSVITAHVNVRSGKAYPYAGIGFNVRSVNKQLAGYLDLNRFDSVAVVAAGGRMKSLTLRIHTFDPQYSTEMDYLSYRILTTAIPVTFSYSKASVALSDLKVPDWWLAGHGLENDDGLRYLHQTMLVEISNGESALRGIPDDIDVKSVLLYGEDHRFTGMMKWVGFAALLLYVVCVVVAYRRSPGYKAAEQAIEEKLEKAAKLLKESDRSVAEIALAVGMDGASSLERHFKRRYGKSPLVYRKENV